MSFSISKTVKESAEKQKHQSEIDRKLGLHIKPLFKYCQAYKYLQN